MSGARWGADVLQYLKPVVVGENALDLGRHWQAMWKRSEFLMMPVIAAMDIALWDLAGNLLGQPVHRLLGTCKDKALAYASSHPMMAAERYPEEALHYQSLGWQGYKVHPRKQPKEDIAICEAVRAAVGGDMSLMLDAMWAYGFEDAIRVGRAIERLDYLWYEDPLPREDVYNSAKLCAALDIPVMSVELAHGGLYGIPQYLTERATDILRGDAVLKGGITPLIKIVHLAEAFNMKCEIHSAANALNNVANLHVTMAAPNCDWFEMLLPHDVECYGLTEDIVVDREGFVHAPQAPGLGFPIDWDLVKRRTTRQLT
jgi:L-alanine-DL-glutamate epimerase-like enolase superfamily enzyme